MIMRSEHRTATVDRVLDLGGVLKNGREGRLGQGRDQLVLAGWLYVFLSRSLLCFAQRALLSKILYRLQNKREADAPDELAVRFHHRLVSIHPFANGNGRHARLTADVLALRQDRPVFTWGGADLVHADDFR